MKKIRRRQTIKIITVTTLMILLGTVLISSGMCSSEIDTIPDEYCDSEVKILTRQDTGILLLSAIFTKDTEVRMFLLDVVSHLQTQGTLSEDEVQSIADNQGKWTPRIFLASKVEAGNSGVILPIPGILSSFFERIPTFSLVLSEYGYLTVNDVDYNYAVFNFLGFVGNVHNHPTERDSRLWRYDVEGFALISIVLDAQP